MSDTGAGDMRRLSHDLGAAGPIAGARAGLALRKALQDIQGTAQSIVPVDTGFLRSSISTEMQGGGNVVRGEVGPTANYGRYVEEGTSQNRAQPYLRPATDAVVPSYEAALGQITDGLL